jgi:hypothetical protein
MYEKLLKDESEDTKGYCRIAIVLFIYVCYTNNICVYQRCNQNQYIEEEQTTQRPKEKVQKE